MLRVLVVEDDKNISLLASVILQSMGFEVMTSEDGAEALDYLQSGNLFTLLVTDIALPKMDGIQLVSIIGHEYPSLRILTMSAFPERLEEARAKGAHHVLKKPFNHTDFIKAVQTTLALSH